MCRDRTDKAAEPAPGCGIPALVRRPCPWQTHGRSLAGALDHGMRVGIAAALVAAAGSCMTGTARAQAAASLPALTPAPTAAHLTGKMVFAALVTPDLISAERFYSSLFGWRFTNAYLGRTLYGQASFAGRTVAAIAQKPMEPAGRPAWRSFLSTDTLSASVDAAVAHGASVLVSPHELANIGRDALLRDPQGAVFGLLTSASGDPPDMAALPGEWIWSSLVTTDPSADATFYRTVLGYDLFPSPDARQAGHLILASGSYARASVNPLPTTHAVSRPRWISYVRVADLDAAAAAVTRLGGTVVVPPHEDSQGGAIALAADPQGALFGLLQWSDDDPGEAK